MVRKTRRWRRRRDGIQQRYWYGRKPKRRKRKFKSVTIHEKPKREYTGRFDEFDFESAKRDKHRPYIVRRYAREPTIEDIEEISRFEKFGRKGEITIPKEKAEKALGKAALVASVHPSVPPPAAHLIDVAKFNISEDITFGGKKEPTQKDIKKLLEEEGFK